MPSLLHVAAFGAGLLLTLCVCAWLTPRAWWRRPNARAAGLLAGGTLAVGAALLALFGPPQAETLASDEPVLAASDAPVAGARYRVHDALNLRAAGGVDAERLLVVPAGSRLTATGRRDGDWWQVRGTVNGATVEGWASSLWLRRADEG
jgi:hypothetical protein